LQHLTRGGEGANEMGFFKRLLGKGKDKSVEPMRGLAKAQTEDEQAATRLRMEDEMAASRERRRGAENEDGESKKQEG
jgi:hypothetical protein